jgi:hypothetical protein
MRGYTIEIFFILFLIVGSVFAVLHEFYMSWFRPSYFREYSSKRVKDWWPFAEFFGGYYASTSWLWIMRIATALCVPFLVLLIYKLVTGQVNLP